MPNLATSALNTVDDFDRRILDIVQKDNRKSHYDIGEKVGLSSSAVRRRITAMRDKGIINRDVSIIHPDTFGVTLITTLTFQNETPEIYDALDQQILDTPEIKQGYHVAGSSDYVLIIHGPSLSWYEDWSKSAFMSNPNIARYSTQVVWSCKKFDTALTIPNM